MKIAQEALEGAAVDHSEDPEKFKEDLMNIARTTLSSKILVQQRDYFAKLAVDAVLRLKVLQLLYSVQSTLGSFWWQI